MGTIGRELIEEAAAEVLKNSAGAQVMRTTAPAAVLNNVSGLIGTLSLVGRQGGTLVVYCDRRDAARLAAGMLGSADEPDEEIIRDALGELVNQIGGSIKRKLRASSGEMMLSVPMVIEGSPLAHRVKSSESPVAVELHLAEGSVRVCLWPVRPNGGGRDDSGGAAA